MTKGKGHRPRALFQISKVLWHLDIFRRSFRDLSGHACMAESCIFCALKELFSQLQFSNETALPPDALRRALAESFFDQQRFQLGFMDDAAECFENILLRIHTHIAQGVAEDMCNVKQCIPHQKFAMTLVEQSICGACQATSEPLSFTQMVHYVSASALTTQGRQNAPNGRKLSTTDSFGELLRKAGSMGDIRDCPSSCGAKIQISRTLMNRPEIVSIGIVWDSERPTLEHIMDVFATVGTNLKLGDVFHKVVDSRWSEITTHNLVGVVTYYGKHYSTFFFHTKFRVWIYFDDATVREIGARWEQVVEKCRRGRHQPLLLLYAVPNGTPVTMESVQQVATMYEKSKVDNQAILRRSVTPSPEKPNIGNTRRAITPNPDSTLGQKPQIPRLYNEYQNLSIIQDNIYGRTTGNDVVDGDMLRKSMEQPKTVSVHRTPSNGSSSGVESFNMPDHIPIIRRRDSGNWSGDRNSASSASSTTMENPYLYLLGKIPHHNNNSGSNSIPSSPTRKTDNMGNSIYDAGYDSYSLSSNDSSSMNTIQHLMKMGHLAKIPEDYNNLSEKPTLNCDTLCNEADELLKKSRHFEDEHDLVLALALCNAAATKARAAMNAPYNNPQTLTLARMKYNTCIMRARSLHRRMTQTPTNSQKEPLPEIRHTREGSSGSGKHSRQNSRDKTHQLSSSRQNSRELLVQPDSTSTKNQSPQKSIEIYATLPKKKDTLKNKVNINFEEDSEYMLYDKPPARESRSIFSKSKNKDSNKESKMREKRSRSEDRNKMSRDFSIAPEILINKDTLKREKTKEDKEDKKEKDGKNKKQHKIRRKLLMGGLIKRKNRSMPDLTDTNENEAPPKEKPVSSVDDSNIGIKNENLNSMCGYLSEGHLEFTGNTTNPTLERSKLMRKSFHGSAGKVLTAAKVPPPPPLRTTSQLSAISKLPGSEVVENDKGVMGRQYNTPGMENNSNYYNYNQLSYGANTNQQTPTITYNHQRTGSHDVLIYQTRDAVMNQVNTVITQAEVHQVQSPIKTDDYYMTSPCHQPEDEGIDEVDCCLPGLSSLQHLELPPYPSPACSVIHSRQASEDFPPPPPPLDLSALEEHLPEVNKPSTLLVELQNKRQEILSQDNIEKPAEITKSGDTWLKELQAKQAALRQKKAMSSNLDAITVQKEQNGGDGLVKSTVKDLASRFENKIPPTSLSNIISNAENYPEAIPNHHQISPIVHGMNGNLNNYITRESKADNTVQTGVLSLKKREDNEMISPDIFHHQNQTHHPFEMQKPEVNLHHSMPRMNGDGDDKKCKAKKKSVSFCDQVILVATAEEQEDDSYIPNPILERVLRTAMNKPEAAAIRQEIALLRQNEGNGNKEDVIQVMKEQNLGGCLEQNSQLQLQNHILQNSQLQTQPQQNCQQSVQPVYVSRQNSVDNLLAPSIPKMNGQQPGLEDYNRISDCRQLQRPRDEFGNCESRFQMQENIQRSQIFGQSPQLIQHRQSPYQMLPSQNYVTLAQSNGQSTPRYGFQPEQHAVVGRNFNQISQQQEFLQNQTAPRTNNGYLPVPNHPIRQNVLPYSCQTNYHPGFQHPPSPSPSNQSYSTQSSYNSSQNSANRQLNHQQNQGPYGYTSVNQQYSPVQRVAPQIDYNSIQQFNQNQNYQNSSPYQRVPSREDQLISSSPQNSLYQRVPSTDQINQYQNRGYNQFQGQNQPQALHQGQLQNHQNGTDYIQNNPPSPYQRVPDPNYPAYQTIPQNFQQKYSPYQQVLPPKQQPPLKKTVSFEPGTKGGSETSPKAVVTPIIVNNNNSNYTSAKTKCNLCRKKHVVAPNLYCTDCEFYMSRFKPKS